MQILGGTVQVVAVTLFALQIGATFHRSKALIAPYIGFVVWGLIWMAAMTLLDQWHTYRTMIAGRAMRSFAGRHLASAAARSPDPRDGDVHDLRGFPSDVARAVRRAGGFIEARVASNVGSRRRGHARNRGLPRLPP
jgi:hypothetical protein